MDEMNLFKTWQTATEQKSKEIKSSKEDIMEAIKSESSSTIGQIKWRLKMKLGWNILFASIALIWMLFDHSNIELFYLQAFLITMFGLGFVSLLRIFNKMNNSITADKDALTVMKSNSNLIRKALRLETIGGLIFIPICAFIGFAIGHIKRGGTIAEAVSDPKSLLILLVVLIILVPLINLGAYKANQISFGDFIEELDQNIIKMENL